MNPGEEPQAPADAISSSEVERLLATVMTAEQTAAAAAAPTATESASDSKKDGVQPYDFRNPMLLTPGELRKLRLHQEEFAEALSSRLSVFLRLEFALKLTGIQTIAYGKLAQSWANPSHLSLFKIEPLRGVSILEIPPRLGLSIVDRLMGGPGLPPESIREMSEIENALLDQAVQLILGEWCSHWPKSKELKPVQLGFETNGKFIQTAPPETVMLVITLEAHLGNCVERIQIGFPHASVEPLIRQLSRSSDLAAEAPPTPAVKPACKWNPCFDDICIPLVAEWQGPELTAREVLALKVGDVIPLNQLGSQHIKVRLADVPKFNGRLGTIAGNWAVELAQVIKR